jgi:hypothetical protein
MATFIDPCGKAVLIILYSRTTVTEHEVLNDCVNYRTDFTPERTAGWLSTE